MADKALQAALMERAKREAARRQPSAPVVSEPPPGFVLNPETGQMVDMQSPNNPYVQEGRGRALMQGVGQGVSFGAMDEAVAAANGLTGPGTFGESRDFAAAVMREELRRAREQHPVAAIGGELAGALAVPVGVAGQGATGIARVLAPAASGAAQGAVYGFNSADGGIGDRLSDAGWGGLLGGILGAAAPAVATGARKIVEKTGQGRALRQAAKGAPSLSDLRAQGNALYAQADQVTNLPRADFASDVQAAVADATRRGMDPDLMPGAATVASRLQDAAGGVDPNIGFRELDTLRRKAAVPAGNVTNRSEQALGSQFIDVIDDFVDRADPALGSVVGEARDTWSRLRRAEMIAEALDVGEQGYMSGGASGVRNKIATILRSPKKSRGFSAAEKAALQRVVNPGPLVTALNYAGSGLGQTAASFGGFSAGGIGGALVGAAGGSMARRASEAVARSRAELAQALIANGGKVNLPTLTSDQQALIEALYMGAVRPTASAVAEAFR